MKNQESWKRDTPESDNKKGHDAINRNLNKTKTIDSYISDLAFEKVGFLNEYSFLKERIDNLKYLGETDKNLITLLERYRDLMKEFIELNENYLKNTKILTRKDYPDDIENISKELNVDPESLSVETIYHESKDGVSEKTQSNLAAKMNYIYDQIEDIKEKLMEKYPFEYNFLEIHKNTEIKEN